jgi:hypothetical protein
MRFSLAFCLYLVACQSQPNPPTVAHAEPTPLAPRNDKPELGPHRPPVVVRMQGPASVTAGQDITLVAEIEQHVGDRAPVTLSLKLPAGVRLVEGAANETLQPANGTLERRFVVHIDSVPAEDIELVANTQSPAFGARASDAYRFGRAQPKLAAPVRGDKDTVVGGKNLGRPIELKPATKP